MDQFDDAFLQKLNDFIAEAQRNTFAGTGQLEKLPERKDFQEFVFKLGDFNYRDSFLGHFQSWGQELVRYKGEPIWSSHYGGGMEPKFNGKTRIANEAFEFLKKAMLAADKLTEFRLRGPGEFIENEWRYACSQMGNIEKFAGHEEITRDGELLFTHDFIGGLIF